MTLFTLGYFSTFIGFYSLFPCKIYLHQYLIHLSLYIDRKLKKLVRALKDKGSAVKEKEEGKPPQQWNLDYALAAFDGLTPEYMEMSESACTYRIIVTGTQSCHLSTKILLK